MTRRLKWSFIVMSWSLSWGTMMIVAALAQEIPHFAGPKDQGFLLPNGWTLKPAGQHVPLADLPLNIIPLADNRHVLAATSGYNAHELSIIDLQEKKVVDHQTVRQSWFGLAVTPEGDRIWWSGGGADMLHAFRLADHRLTRTGAAEPARNRPQAGRVGHFRSGLALDPHRKVLYSLDVDAGNDQCDRSPNRERDPVRSGRHAALRRRRCP